MAYDYIRRAYGCDFTPGQIVTLDEYEGIEGRVMRPQGDPQYVRIEFTRNGKVQRGDFHPKSVTPKAA